MMKKPSVVDIICRKTSKDAFPKSCISGKVILKVISESHSTLREISCTMKILLNALNAFTVSLNALSLSKTLKLVIDVSQFLARSSFQLKKPWPLIKILSCKKKNICLNSLSKIILFGYEWRRKSSSFHRCSIQN